MNLSLRKNGALVARREIVVGNMQARQVELIKAPLRLADGVVTASMFQVDHLGRPQLLEEVEIVPVKIVEKGRKRNISLGQAESIITHWDDYGPLK